MKPRLSLVWNTIVVLTVTWLIFTYRYWLFSIPFDNWKHFSGEENIPAILNGPIYLGLFIAYGLHFSTVYNHRSGRRLILLATTTCIPLIVMACVWSSVTWYRPGDYPRHGGLLLLLSTFVAVGRHSFLQLLALPFRFLWQLLNRKFAE